MENEKTFIDYIGQIFATFGVTILILNVFCKLFGKDAAAISSIFQLEDTGIAFSTAMQFLAVTTLITIIRYIFFTDRLIKKMSLVLRTACMIVLVIALIGIFIYAFAWFPIDMWLAWGMFFLSFFVCFTAGFFISMLKEKAENQALAKALKKLQEEKVNASGN